MAGARKLQLEIDRTLKKVEEGLEEFDALQAKVEACDTHALKMKLEEELKKELKKLQKHRDAVKGWSSGSEVKVKTPLLEARRNIELRMEAFKVIERESKMKAYSKEGLMRDAPLTAEDRRRMKTRDWMQTLTNKLSDEVEVLEAELEVLEEAAASSGGKKKATTEKSPEELLTQVIRSHKFHVDKLELLGRAVDAGEVDCDAVDALKGEAGETETERGRESAQRARERRSCKRCSEALPFLHHVRAPIPNPRPPPLSPSHRR